VSRKLIWTVVVVGVLLAVALGTAYYWTAWTAARAAAISVVLGEDTDLGPSDPSWGQPLGHVARNDVVVQTEAGWLEPSTHQTLYFVLKNVRTPGAPSVELGVDLQLTARGWEVIGYGTHD